MDVGQADACGLHLDEDLTRSGHGDGDLLHGEFLAVQLGEPLLGGLVVAAGLLTVDGGEGLADGGRHTAAVTADVDVRAVLDGLPHRVGGAHDGVLHEPGRVAGHRGVGGVDPRDAGLFPVPHLLTVEVVVLGVAAADEDLRQADLDAVLVLPGPLLQEAAQGRDAGAGADEDQRRGGVGGRGERRGGNADVAVDDVPGLQARDVGGAGAAVVAVAGQGRALQQADGQAHLPWVGRPSSTLVTGPRRRGRAMGSERRFAIVGRRGEHFSRGADGRAEP